jgi:hypothetical protein
LYISAITHGLIPRHSLSCGAGESKNYPQTSSIAK